MTETTPTPDVTVVERYVDFWNADTAAEQQRLATEVLAENITYHAPVGLTRGAGELIGFRDQFAAHAPDYAFRARRQPERHHDRARLQWELMTGGESFATGTDVLEVGADGRISSITSFLDRAPEGFGHDADH